ncbi:MAG: carboxypeptidase regulatory-like domain-containing protein [Planctomycetes bacterium]|nr:carboxypeptidase regulatory-like domain-containing protein [Planctomycetota bacterium]
MTPSKIALTLVFLGLVVAGWFGLREFGSTRELDLDQASGPVAPDDAPRGPTRAPELKIDPKGPSAAPTATTEAEAPTDRPEARGRLHLSGRLLDGQGRPVADAELHLRRPRGEGGSFSGAMELEQLFWAQALVTTRSGADGRFDLGGLAGPKSYLLRVRSERHLDLTRSVALEEERDLDLGDIILEEGASIAGRVLTEGRGIAGVEVMAVPVEEQDFMFVAMDQGLMDRSRKVLTDAQGRFEIGGLPADVWELRTRHDRYQPGRSGPIGLETGQRKTGIDLDVEPGLLIRGRVLDTAGAPLAGAEVLLRDRIRIGMGNDRPPLVGPRDTRSDAEGRFEFTGLADQDYSIIVRKADFMERRTSGHPGTELEVRLEPAGMVFGQIRDARTGDLIGDARVIVRRGSRFGLDEGRNPIFSLIGQDAVAAAGLDEARGLYAIPGVDRAISLDVSAPGYGSLSHRDLTPTAGERRRLDFDLQPEGRIFGRVLDPAGEPIAGAKVEASLRRFETFTADLGGAVTTDRERSKNAAREPATVTSDAEGRFAFRGLAAGHFWLRASLDGFSPSETLEVVVEGGDEHRVELSLQAQARIVGQVLDAEGRPATGRTVELRKLDPTSMADPRSGHRSLKTDGEGRFVAGALVPGRWRAVLPPETTGGLAFFGIDEDGDDEVHQDVELAAGKTVEILLREGRKAILAGRVTSAGRPVANAEIRMGRDEFMAFSPAAARSDDQGRFSIESTQVGAQTLEVRGPGAAISTKVEVELRPGVRSEVEVELPGGAIGGRIRGGGEPLAGLTIGATPDGEAKTRRSVMSFSIGGEDGDVQVLDGSSRVSSDERGRYLLPFLPDGLYTVAVKGKGYIGQSRAGIEVRDGHLSGDVDFELEPGFDLRVELVASTTAFFFLSLVSTDDGPLVEERKGGRVGKQSFSGLRSGHYKLSVQRFGQDGGGTKTEEREVHLDGRDLDLRIDFD